MPLIPRFATNAMALARRAAIRHNGAIMKADAAKERARLDAARRALEDGEHRLETIARHCGFTSAEILRRLFQRRMGLSPTAYRERFASAR